MSREFTKQSEKKKELLDKQIECFKNMIKACEEIKEGKSETFVCHKYNISRSKFRRIIFDEDLGFEHEPIDLPIIDMEDPYYRDYWRKQWEDYCWQEKLFCAVFSEYNINNVPADIDKSVEYVLETLPEKEKNVLMYRFKENLTLNEVGEIYNVSRNRIMQIEAKALRKLRHPSRANVLKYGVEAAEKLATKDEQLEAYREEYYNDIDETINEAKKAMVGADLYRLINVRDKANSIIQALSGNNQESGNNPDVFYPISIDDLSLSVRTYNCVRRAGFECLEDFVGKTVSQMLDIRNMGKHSFKELSERLSDYGIYFIDDRNEL